MLLILKFSSSHINDLTLRQMIGYEEKRDVLLIFFLFAKERVNMGLLDCIFSK